MGRYLEPPRNITPSCGHETSDRNPGSRRSGANGLEGHARDLPLGAADARDHASRLSCPISTPSSRTRQPYSIHFRIRKAARNARSVAGGSRSRSSWRSTRCSARSSVRAQGHARSPAFRTPSAIHKGSSRRRAIEHPRPRRGWRFLKPRDRSSAATARARAAHQATALLAAEARAMRALLHAMANAPARPVVAGKLPASLRRALEPNLVIGFLLFDADSRARCATAPRPSATTWPRSPARRAHHAARSSARSTRPPVRRRAQMRRATSSGCSTAWSRAAKTTTRSPAVLRDLMHLQVEHAWRSSTTPSSASRSSSSACKPKTTPSRPWRPSSWPSSAD